MTLPPGFGELIERLRRATVLVGGGSRGGAGSGVIIDGEGTIATNAHVVRSPSVTVQLHDGTEHEALLTAHDAELDLALLSIRGALLPPIPLGNSHHPRPGELVVAVGNPFGFIGAVSVGTVQGTGPVRGLGPREWIRSDIRLAPGNSGGPLANAEGELVGLNAMIAGPFALAVPAGHLRRFAAAGRSRAVLGIAIRPVSVTIGGETRTGLLVLEIAEGSAAERASLMPGDIVIGLNGRRIGSPDEIHAALNGETERVLRLQFLRGDRTSVRTASAIVHASRNRAA